jgi:hypothetical protein
MMVDIVSKLWPMVQLKHIIQWFSGMGNVEEKDVPDTSPCILSKSSCHKMINFQNRTFLVEYNNIQAHHSQDWLNHD